MPAEAAATKRGRQLFRLAAAQQKPGIFRRLFQRFQQRIRCRFRQLRRLFDPDHFGAAEPRAIVKLLADIADSVDAQRRFALLRLRLIIIRVRARLHQLAGAAFAAAFLALRLLAHAPAAQRVNQRVVAHTGQRMDQ